MVRITCALAAVSVLGCGTQPIEPAATHIQKPPQRTGTIPPPVKQVALPPAPKPAPKAERYTIVVNNVAVRELLFAVARDAKVNVDIHPGVSGTVTLNAVDQTLPQILARIARQVDMRFELDGRNLVVQPDTPYLRHYRVDYVNIARNASGTIGTATQVASTGTGLAAATGGPGAAASAFGAGGNISNTSVSYVSNNRFWETLVQNVKDLLRETDKVLPGPESSATGTGLLPPGAAGGGAANGARSVTYREAASVIANAETGILSVRANSRQQEKVQEFLDQVLGAARRQVLIEATIVEVLLSDQYQAGVDWSRLATAGQGITFNQQLLGGNLATPPTFLLGYTDADSAVGNIAATIRLLSRFGDTKVLSSPKIMALNNQTAILKVVDERVFFTIELSIREPTQNAGERRDFTSTPHSVPVGVVLSVTPQISANSEVSLSIRPTVSRITGFVNDPVLQLQNVNIVSRIPEIQVREMESLLRVTSGQVVVMGGLMQDSVERNRDGVPVLSKLPAIGDAFSFRNDTARKSELVIFLRPVVVREGVLDADLRAYRSSLPDTEFFRDQSAPQEGNGKRR